MCDGSYRAGSRARSANRPDAEVRREAASLESSANNRGAVAEIRPKLCRSCWCPKCGVVWGWKVRRALVKAIRKFQAVQMWTLTVNPSLFESSAAVLEHLKSKRCVGELVRTLRKQGLLLSGQYFYVIEFHKSGVPHIHIIFDAKRIEHRIVQARWHALGPKTADGAPSTLGIVRFSPRKNRFKNPEHAAHYVTKYLIKHPEEGHPEWVMQIRNLRRINRCGHSKGLFSSDAKGSAKTGGDGGWRDEDEAKQTENAPADERGANLSTIGERVARCGQASLVFEKREGEDGRPVRRCLGQLAKPFEALIVETGAAPVGGGIELSWSEAARLERAYGGRDPLPSGMLPRDVAGTPSEPAHMHDERMQDRYAEERARDKWRRQFLEGRSTTEAASPSPTERTGGDPPLQAGGHPAGRQATLHCPLAPDDGCEGDPCIETVGDALVHLRDVHGITGDQALAVVDEAIDDLGDDVSRHRWERAIANALAGLLGEVDADSREKGEAA